jgi:hypothetical protein
MIGDNLLIYNPGKDAFYAGRGEKIYVRYKTTPLWVKDPAKAKCSTALTKYQKICAEIGGGVRIVSETEARRIVRMREYRRQNEQSGTEQGEQKILSFTRALPQMRRRKPGARGTGAVRGVPEEAR